MIFARKAAAFLVVFAACATSGEPDPHTGIEVQVLKGPTQPVAREGESDTAPVSGATVVVEPAAGGKASTAATNASGIARLRLPAGTHRVSVEGCPGAMSLPKQAELVTVSPGSFAAVTLVCDTGIR